jgi:inner membrane transporter RhtA
MFSVQLGTAMSLPMIKEVGPAGTAWLRLTAGAIIFIIIARPRLNAIRKKDWPFIIALGVNTGLVTIGFLAAVQRIPLGTAVAIEFLGPLTVATFKSRTRKAMIWPVIAFIGVLMMTRPWLGEVNGLGILFAAAAAFGWGTYIVLTARIGDSYDGLTGLALTIPIAAITSAAFGAVAVIPRFDVALVGQAFFLALLLPVLPFALELISLRHMSESAFGTLMSVEPAFGTLLGLIILHQQASLLQLIGVSLVVLAGVGSQRIDHVHVETPEIEIV